MLQLFCTRLVIGHCAVNLALQ